MQLFFLMNFLKNMPHLTALPESTTPILKSIDESYQLCSTELRVINNAELIALIIGFFIATNSFVRHRKKPASHLRNDSCGPTC